MSALTAKLRGLASTYRAERHRIVTTNRVTPLTAVRMLTRHALALELTAEQVDSGAQTELYGQAVLDAASDRLDLFHATRRLGINTGVSR